MGCESDTRVYTHTHTFPHPPPFSALSTSRETMRLQPHVLLPLVAAFALNAWFNWKELLLFCLVVAAHAATTVSDSDAYGPLTLQDDSSSSSSPPGSTAAPFAASPSFASLASGKIDSLLDAAVQSELVGRRYVSETGVPSSSLTRVAAAEVASVRLRPDPHMMRE